VGLGFSKCTEGRQLALSQGLGHPPRPQRERLPLPSHLGEEHSQRERLPLPSRLGGDQPLVLQRERLCLFLGEQGLPPQAGKATALPALRRQAKGGSYRSTRLTEYLDG
jgi:hypothetical protein